MEIEKENLCKEMEKYKNDASFFEQTHIIKLSSIQVEGEILSKENEDFEL